MPERDTYWFPGGQLIEIKLDGASTEGQLMVLEATVEPGGGADEHVHHNEDEGVVVLEGELELTVGGEVRTVRAGEVAWMPHGVPHAFRNSAGVRARALGFATPAGLEHLFRSLGEPRRTTERPAGIAEYEDGELRRAYDQAGMELRK